MLKWLIRGGMIALAAWAAAPAVAQTWIKSGDRLNFDFAHISVPLSPGVTTYYETREFSHKGTGLDTAAEFKSPDGAVFATVYAYVPTLADPGLAALTTYVAITLNYGGPVERGPDEVRAAAGRPGAALETRYAHYRGDLASRAAFLRAGRWLIKIRVSGPETRGQEVDATMGAILDGMRLPPETRVATVRPIAAAPCAMPKDGDAKLLADDPAAIMEDAFTAVVDATEPLAATKKPPAIPQRLGSRWCRATLDAGTAHVPILLALDASERKRDETKTVMLVLYSDNGNVLEIVRSRRGYLLLHHAIAETAVLGTFGAPPSEAQIRDLLTGAGSDAVRVRARVELRPNGDAAMIVPPATKTGRGAPTT
jgi:hypothetical protein